MKLIILTIISFVLAVLSGAIVALENLPNIKGVFTTTNNNVVNESEEMKKVDTNKEELKSTKLKMLKDVGEVYMDNLGLYEEDYQRIKDSDIDIIESNFDICSSYEEIKKYLDLSLKYGLKVIMPAGSGEAEWGYECDKEPYPANQKPNWDKEAVLKWVKQWKDHPAVYAWDISNEAGSVFPNASEDKMLTVDQLKSAYKDIKSVDSEHPIMIRMNGWYFYDYEENFFRAGNPFDSEVADIVMVNAYSNVDEYFPDFVTTVSTRAIYNIHKIDSDAKIIIALGSWEEPPLWVMPSIENFRYDLGQLDDLDLLGVAFFKYGAMNSEWYLPKDASSLLEVIKGY